LGYSSDDVIKALIRLGFELYPKRGKGSHVVLYKKDEDLEKTRIVVIPKRKELKKGTLAGILRQAGISFEELKKNI